MWDEPREKGEVKCLLIVIGTFTDVKSGHTIDNYGDDDDPTWMMYHESAEPDDIVEARATAERTIEFCDIVELLEKDVGHLDFEPEDTDEGVGMCVHIGIQQMRTLMSKYMK